MDGVPNPDLVRRQFKVDALDVLWVSDITEHKPTRANSTWQRSSMPTAPGQSDCQLPTTCARSWWWMPFRWRSGGAGLRRGERFATRTAAVSTPLGRSAAGLVVPGCSVRWAPSEIARITPWPSRSSPPCRWSCWIARHGGLARIWRWQSSSTSRPFTTRSAGTLPSDISAPWSSKPFTKWSALPHDQLTQPVRRTGAISFGGQLSVGGRCTAVSSSDSDSSASPPCW